MADAVEALPWDFTWRKDIVVERDSGWVSFPAFKFGMSDEVSC